jgi:hypothetical protein
MATVKFTALPAAASSALGDIIAGVDGTNTSVRETLGQVLTLYQASATNFTGLTGVLKAPTAIQSSSSENLLVFSYTASAVNYFQIRNGIAGSTVGIDTAGASTNVGAILTAKGAGGWQFRSGTATNPISMVPNSDTNAFAGTFAIPTITAARTYTLQDASGTLAFTTQINTWVDQTTTPVTMAVNTGYTSDAGASLITFTLPATSAIGDWVEINGKGAGLYTIAQAAGQQIVFGNVSSTLGVGGSVSSQLVSDNIKLRCITANTIWTVVSSQGNFTIV